MGTLFLMGTRSLRIFWNPPFFQFQNTRFRLGFKPTAELIAYTKGIFGDFHFFIKKMGENSIQLPRHLYCPSSIFFTSIRAFQPSFRQDSFLNAAPTASSFLVAVSEF